MENLSCSLCFFASLASDSIYSAGQGNVYAKHHEVVRKKMKKRPNPRTLFTSPNVIKHELVDLDVHEFVHPFIFLCPYISTRMSLNIELCYLYILEFLLYSFCQVRSYKGFQAKWWFGGCCNGKRLPSWFWFACSLYGTLNCHMRLTFGKIGNKAFIHRPKYFPPLTSLHIRGSNICGFSPRLFLGNFSEQIQAPQR